MKRAAFTLVELLVAVTIVAVLGALLLPALSSAKVAAARATSAASLRALAAGGNLYLAEHEGIFWKYSEAPVDNGTQWWFGWESNVSRYSTPEGERTLDVTRGPLGPYAVAAGGVRTDPAFAAYRPRLKPKYKDGNYGYGYNALLAGRNARGFERPGQVVVFATCAQVNTFQAPASAANPMVEEFYLINDRETTVHFRHGGRALAACLDGSVRDFEMALGTLDTRLPAARIGRFAPVGSRAFLGD